MPKFCTHGILQIHLPKLNIPSWVKFVLKCSKECFHTEKVLAFDNNIRFATRVALHDAFQLYQRAKFLGIKGMIEVDSKRNIAFFGIHQ